MKKFTSLTVAVLLIAATANAADANKKKPLPKGRRLREIIAEKYPKDTLHVGAATCWHKRPIGVGAISDREYNHVTPENDFKQSLIHPEPDKWNWEASDAWIKHCDKIGQTIRVHGPISPQCSKWIREDERTPEVIEQILREYLAALYQRYDKYPHVKWFDVVNEVTNNGKWKKSEGGVKEWEMPWEQLGYDKSTSFHIPKYIIIAFEIANQHAQNSQLIINQHTDNPKDWDNIKKLVTLLRKKGLRVDGIGWQAHVNTGWEKNPHKIKWLEELIAWAQANDLSFHITEMNA